MMMFRHGSYKAISLLWFATILVKYSLAEYFDSLNFSNITRALYGDVKFITERLDQVNIDTIFGLTLAEANLAAILSSTNAKYLPTKEKSLLIAVVELCVYGQARMQTKFLQNNNHPLAPLMKILTRSDIWIRDISWREGSLGYTPSAAPYLTVAKVTSLFFRGTPREAESDHCLIELVAENCQVSDTCTEMLLKADGSRGYPLTHRLLFIQTAKSLQCKVNPKINVTALTTQYCREILQDLVDLESVNFPSVSKDLAMEQILLCGMEGFLEFVNKHYTNLILSWQNSFGCYTAFNFNGKSKNNNRKRSTMLMDHNCDSHASGVAAAALSLLIRGHLENW